MKPFETVMPGQILDKVCASDPIEIRVDALCRIITEVRRILLSPRVTLVRDHLGVENPTQETLQQVLLIFSDIQAYVMASSVLAEQEFSQLMTRPGISTTDDLLEILDEVRPGYKKDAHDIARMQQEIFGKYSTDSIFLGNLQFVERPQDGSMILDYWPEE